MLNNKQNVLPLMPVFKRLIQNQVAEITKRSFLDAHAIGLHSLMLVDNPEGRVRMFYAATNHTLWCNDPSNLDMPFSIGFHSHNRHIQLVALKGVMTNWVIMPVTYKNEVKNTMNLSMFEYNSKIVTNDVCRFSHIVGNCRFITKRLTCFSKPSVITLNGNDLHTVYVPRGRDAAWLVIEGEVNETYQSVCYSNRRLDKCDFSHLYRRPTQSDILHIVDNVF